MARHAFLGEVILVHSKLWDNKVFHVLASSGRSPQQDYETRVPVHSAIGQLCGYLLLHTALTSLTFGLLVDKAGERAGRKILGWRIFKLLPVWNFITRIFKVYVCLQVFNVSLRHTGWLSGQGSTCRHKRCRRHGFDPWVEKIPCRRYWQPTPVLLMGKSHGQRSWAGYSPWGCRESDTTKGLSIYSHAHIC